MSKAEALGPAWQPTYIEAKLIAQARKRGYEGTVDQLDDEQVGKVFELVELMTNEQHLRTYPNEAARARLLSTSAQGIRTLKATKLYRDAFLQAIELRAMEGTAAALPTMQARASNDQDPSGVAAFEKMMRVAGIGQNKGVTVNKTNNNVQVNISFDQQMKNFVKERQGKMVDAE